MMGTTSPTQLHTNGDFHSQSLLVPERCVRVCLYIPLLSSFHPYLSLALSLSVYACLLARVYARAGLKTSGQSAAMMGTTTPSTTQLHTSGGSHTQSALVPERCVCNLCSGVVRVRVCICVCVLYVHECVRVCSCP